ncbi:MAG: hypothetical protein R3D51_07030 [Hyphomicrobiaceae bacterium]
MSAPEQKSAPETKKSPAFRFSSPTQSVMAGAAVLLPTLTLVPLGGLYLWEHRLLLWWALAALIMAAGISLALRYALPPHTRADPIPPGDQQSKGDVHWTRSEAEAWKDVLAIAARVDVDKMTSTDYFVELGQQTLDSVAKRLHGEKPDALWRFTLPEALAIVERVSRRLGKFVVASVPFGDRLTVAQVLAAYRWRGAMDVAERAYDIWRILRIVNPATAVTNEARERLSRALYDYGKEHVSRRIAEAFVEEVGRAAIDLYGGRLKVAERLKVTEEPELDLGALDHLSKQRVVLRLVIGGGSRSDRLGVASLLSDALDKKAISRTTAPDMAITVVDQPEALRSEAADTIPAVKELDGADIVVWLAADETKEADLAVMKALRTAQEALSADEIPPLLLPTFVQAGPDQRSKAELEAASRSLTSTLGSPFVSGVMLGQIDVAAPDDMAPLVDAIADRLAQARRVHTIRRISDAKRTGGWGNAARQAWRAAGSLTRAVTRRSKR